MHLFRSDHAQTLVTLEVGSPGFDALNVALQPLREGRVVVLRSKRVQDARHSLRHLL